MKQYIFLGCLIGLAALNFGSCNRQETEDALLKDLLESDRYNSRVRPSGVERNGNGPTVVKINIFIRDIEFIDEQKKELGMQIIFRQKWQDSRLAYNTSADLKHLTVKDVSKLWTPDVFFSNEKSAKVHELMRVNQYIRIYRNGTVLHSSRMSLSTACEMSYRLFPFDSQLCALKVASYAYTTEDIIFEFKEFDPVPVTPNVSIEKFDFKSVTTEDCDSVTTTGRYSCLQVNFEFSRKFNSYLLNVYIPCTMMVMCSWLGIFLDKSSVTARSLSSLATLFVLATQVHQLNANLPSTKYTKAIDVWTGMCLTFIFSTFAEYIIVLQLSREEAEADNQNVANHSLLDTDKNGFMAAKKLLPGSQHLNTSDKFDFVFRTVYPFAFALFCVVYFIVY